ncbi:sensor histidine kinase [Bacillus sp. CHD6a]|uniref:sensor histidine kinase n=1 Tax=Bacillus sp. CHD6a TaxID=1643452 RepID=UPI0006CD0396|nr:sensor histidine kinase [Bacillus sp. CHD6a]KPB03782.1 histidine kinase [Bacillus sp. CHD6a]
MSKRILKRFLKDRGLLISFYLFNMGSVISFFHLSESANTEILYPLSIGFFLLLVYLLIDGYCYYQVNRAIEYQQAEFNIYTEEQRAFYKWIKKLSHEHSRVKNEQNEKNKERLYFLSHWMHHLKTPVSVMDLIIQNEKKLQGEREVFQKLHHENKRLHSAIEQGLTMIRMDSFENDLDIKSTDLLSSLRKLINNRKSEFIYQSAFPVLDSKKEAAFIITDQKWNEAMLDQIISNAIKYSGGEEGSKKIIFYVKQEEEVTLLSIKDEGVGIPPYDLERVFEAFFTGENGREYQNSSGIGLYLCKRIADRLNHRLTIESEVSKGTTVTIRYLTKV